MEMTDGGQSVRDALAEANEITSLTVRYEGSPMFGPASLQYQAEELNFPLKVATVVDLDLDLCRV